VEGSGTTNLPKQYSFADNNLSAGKYLYRLKQIDRDGKFYYSEAVEAIINGAPKEFALEQNYPNPFNPSTVIEFTIPPHSKNNSLVLVKVYNSAGQEIRTIFDEVKEPGNYKILFNAAGLPSGAYFYEVITEDLKITKRMLYLK
jgi:hypothetical protein